MHDKFMVWLQFSKNEIHKQENAAATKIQTQYRSNQAKTNAKAEAKHQEPLNKVATGY